MSGAEHIPDRAVLRQFIGEARLDAMLCDAQGRERLAGFAERFAALPVLSQQSVRDIPRTMLITLCYRTPSWSFWVIGRDARRPEAPQAFGVVRPNKGGSYLASLNLGEIVSLRHVDLDVDWKPVTLGEVLAPPSRRQDEPEPDFLPGIVG